MVLGHAAVAYSVFETQSPNDLATENWAQHIHKNKRADVSRVYCGPATTLGFKLTYILYEELMINNNKEWYILYLYSLKRRRRHLDT